MAKTRSREMKRFGKGILSYIVPEGHEFPAGRTCRCCGKKVRAGESVLVFPVQHGMMIVHVVFHREKLLDFVDQMPLGRNEAQAAFDRLRERIIRSGKAIPD